MKKKVSIIGSGKTGSTLALILALQEADVEIRLFDSQRKFAQAKAMDLEQSLPLLNSSTVVKYGKSYKELNNSQIVVVTEGQPKSDTVHREDLLVPNSKLVRKIAKNIRKHAPNTIVIVLSNPYDAMTGLVLQETGFSPLKVFGSAGLLYANRFRTFVAKECGIRPSDVETLFVGGGSPRFGPLLSQTTVKGKQIEKILSKNKIANLVSQTQEGANELIQLFGDGAAYVAPAAAAFIAIHHILNPSKEMFTVAVDAQGAYGVTGVLNLPVLLGKKGVKKVVQLDISPEEQELLTDASDHYWNLVKPLNFRYRK